MKCHERDSRALQFHDILVAVVLQSLLSMYLTVVVPWMDTKASYDRMQSDILGLRMMAQIPDLPLTLCSSVSGQFNDIAMLDVRQRGSLS